MNRIRPGVSVNVVGSKPLAVEIGSRGVVALPLPLSWGKVQEFVAIESLADLQPNLGYGATSPNMLPITEALKNAAKVLVYRLNAGDVAAATINTDLAAEAVYPGVRGNDLSITVTGSGPYVVKTYLFGSEVDSQTVTAAGYFVTNAYIKLTGTGNLVAATANLAGGSDGAVTATDYEPFLAACRLVDYNVIGYVGTDTSVKNLIVAFVSEERTNDNKVQCVIASNTNSYDSEGVVAVCNGVVLNDGTVLAADKVTAWVAGATAGASVSESNTFRTYTGAVNVSERLTKSQIEAAIDSGLFVFTSRGSRVIVEYDINTLISFSIEKPKDFRKNKIIRVLDSIHNDIISIYEENYIGKVQNNAAGRNLLKGSLVEYMMLMQAQGAIEGFEPTDIIITQGADKDTVNIVCGVVPTDTVDKIFVTVEVK